MQEKRVLTKKSASLHDKNSFFKSSFDFLKFFQKCFLDGLTSWKRCSETQSASAKPILYHVGTFWMNKHFLKLISLISIKMIWCEYFYPLYLDISKGSCSMFVELWMKIPTEYDYFDSGVVEVLALYIQIHDTRSRIN